MTWYRVFIVVTGCSMVGMVMGGLFGLVAGSIASEFFRHLIIDQEIEPLGVASFFGAMFGVLLGGGLGCFGIAVQLGFAWIQSKAADRADKPGLSGPTH